MLFLTFIASLLQIGLLAIVDASRLSSRDGQHIQEVPSPRHKSTSGAIDHSLKRQETSSSNGTTLVYPAYNFSMPVDHFNASDDRMYHNRYWIDDTYYELGGPVIWHDIGEFSVTDALVHRWLGESQGTTAAMALARRYHGLVVLLELRYFGFSLPFPLDVTDSPTIREPIGAPATWQYNTLEQGLEDAVYFANHFDKGDYQRDNMTALLPQNAPWIIIGGSFPGVRAASVRARNPETFYAAWASSAPVQATYDGSNWFDGAELSLYSNCSTDIKAVVGYADEIMSGTRGFDAFQNLQRLVYASTAIQSDLIFYNSSRATLLEPFDIASQMASPFTFGFAGSRPADTTWTFCNFFEQFDPDTPGTLTNDTSLSVVTNPGNALPSDLGLVASHNNNVSVALDAYFYALAAYQTYKDSLSQSTAPAAATESTPQEPDNPSQDVQVEIAAWSYVINTQFGWYLGSNPANVSIVSAYNNFTTQQALSGSSSFSNTTRASFPSRPDTSTFNKLGGWTMNPTNVMFTSGAWDPWRAGSVFSLNTDNGAPGFHPSDEIPACDASLGDPDARFGIVYPEAVHVPDLKVLEDVYGQGVNTPFERGLVLFTQALDVWLPCFGKSAYGADM